MPTPIGAHNAHLDAVRELRTKKGRRERGAYLFEGPTLLREALAEGVEIREIYVTQAALQNAPEISEAEARCVPVFLVDERTMRRISGVETPTGVAAVTPALQAAPETLLAEPGLVALLAGLNDPGNAGTLLRSAEAFGIDRVIFGTPGVEPYHPKTVRAAMGSLFRVRVAGASAARLREAAQSWTFVGLSAAGEPIAAIDWPERCIVAVGHERGGLGEFGSLCARVASIPMRGRAESLNAAAAGSIAFYEAAKRRR